MSVYILDIVFIVIALSIIVTTTQKNYKVHLRRGICAVIAYALTFFVAFSMKDKIVNLLSSLGLINYLAFIPSELFTQPVKEIVGFVVLVLAGSIVYVLLLLICKMFSKEGKRLKKDRTYSPVHRPLISFIASLFKVVAFVYMTALFVYVCGSLFIDYNPSDSLIYPLLENNGLIVWAKELKEIALAVLG